MMREVLNVLRKPAIETLYLVPCIAKTDVIITQSKYLGVIIPTVA